jgi:nucleotide-binding universal stress UspA family protein
MVTIKRILVATDFGEASMTALRYGRMLATSFGATLDVLHVTYTPHRISAAGLESYFGLAPEAQTEIERVAREETEALLTVNDRRVLDARAVTITSDTTAVAVVEYARANDIDLIIVGTHGRRALARLVMGSVAERVVRTAPCPVLTVHSLEYEFVLPDVLRAAAHEQSRGMIAT